MTQQLTLLASTMDSLSKHLTQPLVLKARRALSRSTIYPLLEIACEQETRVIKRYEPNVITKEWAAFIVSFLKGEELLSRYILLTQTVLYQSFIKVEKVLLQLVADP